MAEEDLRVVLERYRVGVATILDVVTSQIAFDQARVNLVGARYDLVTAKAELAALSAPTVAAVNAKVISRPIDSGTNA